MSCYRPLTIQNPALVKSNVYDKATLEVPCGHCPACKETKRLSWFVRLYYEWQYCIDNGGFALFETLTYNNEHLPFLYDYFDGVKVRKCYPCFSTRDIQLYLKKIRKHIRSTYPKLNLDGKIKYFLSMEYGGKTHRPHYHVVFFVSSGLIRPFDFKHLVECKWHENGFTKAGALNNGFVCGQGGLSYCAKYVCKDLYEDVYFRDLKYKLEKMGISEEQYKPVFPHNMQSKNLGIYALVMDKYNDLDNFFNGEIYLPDKDNVIKKYKLPLYYERKIFYNTKYRFFDNYTNDYIIVSSISDVPSGVEYTPIYMLNELGLEMKDKRLQKSLDATANVYRVSLSIPSLPDVLKRLNNKFNLKYENLKDWQKDIKEYVPEELFVSYSLVYRGSVVTNDYCPVSFRNDNAYYDYRLVNQMKAGIRPLSVDFDNLCTNIDLVNSIPYLEDYYQQIRYVYFLIHLDIEEIFIRKEYEYVDNKSAFLAKTECLI